MKPIIVNRKPCKCPKCGGKVVKLVYGEPGPELFEMAERKEVVLGGCDWEHRTDSSEIKMKNPGILSDYRDMSNQ